jgi:hypothetical protein
MLSDIFTEENKAPLILLKQFEICWDCHLKLWQAGYHNRMHAVILQKTLSIMNLYMA